MLEETHKNTEIRSYLLGTITQEDERRKIEERLMTNDDFFQELLIQESELIQDYVDGHLNETELPAFEKNFLLSEERQHKLKVARALRRYIDEPEEAADFDVVINDKEKTSVASLWKFFSSPLPAAIFALIIITFSALLIWKLTAHSSDNDETLASLNKAYEKGRPFEARISGFNYAPANNMRGTSKDNSDSVERELAENVALSSVRKAATAENLHELGRVRLANKEFDKAIEQLEKAERLSPQNAEILSDLGTAYLEKSKRLPADDGFKSDFNARALEKFEKAIQLNPNSLEARFNKALSLQELRATAEARKAWDEYLKLDSSSKWAEEVRRKLESLAPGSQSKTKEQVLNEFLISYQNKNDSAAWQVTSRNREIVEGKLIHHQLALLFLTTEDKEKQENLSALKYAADLEKRQTDDGYFVEIANFYASSTPEKQLLLKDGHSFMKNGFKLFKEAEYKAGYEDFKKAQESFDKAGDVWEAKLNEYWAAFMQYNLANLDEHKRTLEGLVNYCQERNYKWLLAEIYIWLGVNAEEATEYSKAIEYHKKAAKLSEEISDTYNQQKALTILAEEYAKLRQYQLSLVSIQKSLDLSAQLPETSSRQKWRNFNSAATIFYSLKYYTAATIFENEALAIGEESQDQTFNFVANLNLGIISGQQQKYKEAIEFLNQSRAIAESLSESETRDKYLALVYTNLTNLKRLAGDCNDAMSDFDKAIEYSAAKNKPEEYNARKGRLLCYLAQNDKSRLEQELPVVLNLFEQNRRSITEEASRNTFFDNEQDVYDLAIDYEYSKGNKEQAFNYSEISRARSLLDSLKHGAKLSDEEVEVKFSEFAEPWKLEEIRQAMDEQAQIVQYSVLEDKVLIWLITKNSFDAVSSPIQSKDLNEKVVSYLEILSDRTKESFDEEDALSKEIYQILISPIKTKLDPTKELTFVPDKFLSRLPFPALISPESKKFLVEDFASFYAPSTNVFLISSENAKKQVSDRAQEKILIIGNPTFDQNQFSDLPSLPSAEKEAKEIKDLYQNQNSTVLTDKDATKDNVKHHFSQAEIVHFAGHYVIDALSPMRSFLLLVGKDEDARLSNYELMKETLSPRLKLIILSACETGVERYYNGEGMIGASRTFLEMRIPLIIASQWRVDSDATEILMSKFHKYRKQENLSSVAALRRAQLDMLGEHNKDYKKPFYWAAFAPIGGHTQF
jgi:CHAT domain-containing protein/Flp pilus assembly protein TadD